jgi:hypothetical protein
MVTPETGACGAGVFDDDPTAAAASFAVQGGDCCGAGPIPVDIDTGTARRGWAARRPTTTGHAVTCRRTRAGRPALRRHRAGRIVGKPPPLAPNCFGRPSGPRRGFYFLEKVVSYSDPVTLGCLMLVDGWNHYLQAERCFGKSNARSFPIDRLASELADTAGVGPISRVVVVMALPDSQRPEEASEAHAWRKKLRTLRNFDVHHQRARFSYHGTKCPTCRTQLSRTIVCLACGEKAHVANRRREKGADVEIALQAVNSAWNQEYSSLLLLSQDSDFGPMVRHVKEIHQTQQRFYNLYSAFPVCDSTDHEHRGVPGMRRLEISAETYSSIIDRPRRSPITT